VKYIEARALETYFERKLSPVPAKDIIAFWEQLFKLTSAPAQIHARKLDDHGSKLQAFSKKIQSLVENIEALGHAMDVLANTSSRILPLLWGSIRVVLHASFP
jgi:hypothetical protein